MSISNYPKFNKIDENPTVLRLLRNTPPVEENIMSIIVLALFQSNTALFAIPVVNHKNVPTGIVERQSFVEIFTKTYTKEIYGKKKIVELMNKFPLIVNIETSIDDVANIIIDAGIQHMVNGFIATDEGQYVGIANGYDLLNEITQRKQANLFYLAHFDQLTKLPNRILFQDRLSMAIMHANREKSLLGLLFIDLDNFKHFNDSMGHGFGDQLLLTVTTRLSSCARDSDTVARLSGDEFTIVLENMCSKVDIDILCIRILETMKEPMQIMGREVFITASIGTSSYPNDDIEATGLLAKADAAMYEAKRSGRNTFRHYTLGMNVYSLDRMSLETDLRVAVERNEFELFYQPQLLFSTKKVVGNEALIRWWHPTRGLLTPVHFIEIAEETGLIVSIGKWVLQQACKQQMIWLESGLEPMSMSVNISAMQFYQTDFIEVIRNILNESGMQPKYLELELTESLFMHNVDNVLKTLNSLHDIGVKLSIDDFGTGYSNLSYLRRFPIDRLKVDQSFIRNIENEPVNAEIVRAISALGKSMSLDVLVEGVETEAEMTAANENGCKFIQGYRFSKPLPANELEAWLKVNNQTLL